MSKPQSGVKRQADRRKRCREQGFKLVTIWVHQADEAKVDLFKETLIKPQVFSDAGNKCTK